jgi:hypothetical protein
MKLIKFFAAALIMAATFTACSKDKNDTAASKPFNIVGLWEGKLGTGVAIPSGYIGLDIKEGGQFDRVSSGGTVAGSGTWTLNGTEFKAQYLATNGVTVKYTATLDKVLERLSAGKWENTGGGEGTWFAGKKNE